MAKTVYKQQAQGKCPHRQQQPQSTGTDDLHKQDRRSDRLWKDNDNPTTSKYISVTAPQSLKRF